MREPVTVIGAGLAGCEAAWQLARRGIPVVLREMKPQKMTPAHHAASFGELVCSNSLRSDQLENAVGLLKEELRRLGSLISPAPTSTGWPPAALWRWTGGLRRRRHRAVRSHPNITVKEGEVTAILPETGRSSWPPVPSPPTPWPGTSPGSFPGSTALHFYDAAAPLVTFESIDMDSAWFASRYDRGTAGLHQLSPDPGGVPDAFWQELTAAKEAQVHGFEDWSVFEGCMPVEVMARRGVDTLCYGPLKPVGLRDPKTGKEPYAVVQLRRDNAAGSIYNIVGFQTHLTLAGTEAGVLPDPRPAAGGVCPLRGDAPQHLSWIPPACWTGTTGCGPSPGCLCRADHRGGGLCGVHCLRLRGRPGAGPAAGAARQPVDFPRRPPLGPWPFM